MRIALDAMGGDHAPKEVVQGAILAASEYQVEIVLVGDQKVIERELQGDTVNGLITVEHAPEVIGMDEHPAAAVRRKRNASVVVCNTLVKEGLADAVVSAGNTGAAMAASLFGLGRIKGIERPAIGTVIPTGQGSMVLTDAGANADCKAKHLQQFAVMASVYADKVLGIDNPKVALINIGAEETKGNELTQGVYSLLKNTAGINFVGNVEGRDLMWGPVHVAVCDGFVGNVVLKTLEGTAMFVLNTVKKSLEPLMAEVDPVKLKQVLTGAKKHLDYSEYGGAPLLGVNGVSIVSHGSSEAYAIKNAVRVAKESVTVNLVAAIADSIGLIEKEELA
ncbi:phosphate acyltransferase PlsX [Peptococcaceae bacterium 1198_IL3148]